MELIFWSQAEPWDQNKIGTHWLTGTQTPHLRSFPPTPCPAGDVQGCVLDEWGRNGVKKRTLKWIRAWPPCWGRSSQTRGPTTLLVKSSCTVLLSLGFIGVLLPALQLPKCHHLLRPSSRLYSLQCPAGPLALPTLSFPDSLSVRSHSNNPRHSFTHSCCMSLLLCISTESTRRHGGSPYLPCSFRAPTILASSLSLVLCNPPHFSWIW